MDKLSKIKEYGTIVTDEIAEEIFKNIMQKDSDFIVDYKNDKRRWKNATKEEIRQATNITLPSAITSHPEIVIKSNYNKATNTRVNNIDLNFGKITINSDEDIKNLAYYCCDLAHNLEQCVLSKIKRELQIQQ